MQHTTHAKIKDCFSALDTMDEPIIYRIRFHAGGADTPALPAADPPALPAADPPALPGKNAEKNRAHRDARRRRVAEQNAKLDAAADQLAADSPPAPRFYLNTKNNAKQRASRKRRALLAAEQNAKLAAAPDQLAADPPPGMLEEEPNPASPAAQDLPEVKEPNPAPPAFNEEKPNPAPPAFNEEKPNPAPPAFNEEEPNPAPPAFNEEEPNPASLAAFGALDMEEPERPPRGPYKAPNPAPPAIKEEPNSASYAKAVKEPGQGEILKQVLTLAMLKLDEVKAVAKPAATKYVRPDKRDAVNGAKYGTGPEAQAARLAKEELAKAEEAKAKLKEEQDKKNDEEAKANIAHMEAQRQRLISGAREIAVSDLPGWTRINNLLDLMGATQAFTRSTPKITPELVRDVRTILNQTNAFSQLDWNHVLDRLIQDDKLTDAGKGACQLNYVLWDSECANQANSVQIPEIAELAEFARSHGTGPISQSEIEQALTHDALCRTGRWGTKINAGAVLANVDRIRQILRVQIGEYSFELSDVEATLKSLAPILERTLWLIKNPPDLIKVDRSSPKGWRRKQVDQFAEIIDTIEAENRQSYFDKLNLREVADLADRLMVEWDEFEAQNREKTDDFALYARGVFALLVSVGGIDAEHMDNVKKFFNEVLFTVIPPTPHEIHPVPKEKLASIHSVYAAKAPEGCVLSPELALFMYSALDASVLEFLTSIDAAPEDVRAAAPPGAISAVVLRPPLTCEFLVRGPQEMEDLKKAMVATFESAERPPSELTHSRVRWADAAQKLRTEALEYGDYILKVPNTREIVGQFEKLSSYHDLIRLSTLRKLLDDLNCMANVLKADIARATELGAKLAKLRSAAVDNLNRISVLTPEQHAAILAHAKAEEESRRANLALENKTQEDAARSAAARKRAADTMREAVNMFLQLGRELQNITLSNLLCQTRREFPYLSGGELSAGILSSEIGELVLKKKTPQQHSIALVSNFSRYLIARTETNDVRTPDFVRYAFEPPRNSETLRFSKDLELCNVGNCMQLFLALIHRYGFVPTDDGNTPEGYLRWLEAAYEFRFDKDYYNYNTPGVYTFLVTPFFRFLESNFGRLPINQFSGSVKYKVRSFPKAPANSSAGEFKDTEFVLLPDLIGRVIEAVQAYPDAVYEARQAITIPGGYASLVEKLLRERITEIDNRVPARWYEFINRNIEFSQLPDEVFGVPNVSLEDAMQAIKDTKKREGIRPRDLEKRISAATKRLKLLAAEAQDRNVRTFIRDLEAKYPAVAILPDFLAGVLSTRARAELQGKCDSIAEMIAPGRRKALVAQLDHYLRTGAKLPGLLAMDTLLPLVNTKIIDAMSAKERSEWVSKETNKILDRSAAPRTPESEGLSLIEVFTRMMGVPMFVFLLHTIAGGDSSKLDRVAALFTMNPHVKLLQKVCDRIKISAVPVLIVLNGAGVDNLDALVRTLFNVPATMLVKMINAEGRVGSAIKRLAGQAFDELNRNSDQPAIKAANAYIRNSLCEKFGNSLPFRRREIFEQFFENLALAYKLKPRAYLPHARDLFARLPQEVMLGNFDVFSRAVALLANAEQNAVTIVMVVFNSYRDNTVVDLLKLIVSMYKASHAFVPAQVLDAADPRDAAEIFSEGRAERYGIFIGDPWTQACDLTPALMSPFTYVAFIGNNSTDCRSMIQLRASIESGEVIKVQADAQSKWKGKRTSTGESLAWTTRSQGLTCAAVWAAGIHQDWSNILHLRLMSNQYNVIVVPGCEGPNITFQPSFREFAVTLPIVTAILAFPDNDEVYKAESCEKNYLAVP